MNEFPTRFALIIGAMKSGTTSLFHYLAQHPEVAPCSTKEPQYFSNRNEKLISLDEYRSLWEWDPLRHRIALEASTTYSKIPSFPDVAQRIATIADADFRFIYIMRDPLRRLESQIQHDVFRGGKGLDIAGYENALKLSCYATQLDAYTRVFPMKSLLLLVFEELFAEPAAALRRVCSFLGIDLEFSFNTARVHHRGVEFSASHPLARAMVEGRFASVLNRSPFRESVRRQLKRLLPHRERVHLTPQERGEALAQLRPDFERLRDVYGVDLERHWGIEL